MPIPLDLLKAENPESLGFVRALFDRARCNGITNFTSPVDWRDEVLYFLLPDRYRNGSRILML
jgi:hypothetical protein